MLKKIKGLTYNDCRKKIEISCQFDEVISIIYLYKLSPNFKKISIGHGNYLANPFEIAIIKKIEIIHFCYLNKLKQNLAPSLPNIYK